MSESFGSSVQHVAFRTNDIFGAASALRTHGFQPLHISGNYYEDVEARFGLDPHITDRLRAENILYDRDGGGEYLQMAAWVQNGHLIRVPQPADRPSGDR